MNCNRNEQSSASSDPPTTNAGRAVPDADLIQAATAMRDGVAAMEQEHFDQAIAHFSRALELNT